MDQIKSLLRVLHKHHFWILSLLTLIIAGVGCYLASAALTKEFAKNKDEVNDCFTKLRRIGPDHPNNRVNEKIDELTDLERQEVNKKWKQLYDKQKQEVLSWPNILGPKFIQGITPEGKRGLRFGDNLPDHMRETYQGYVKELFRELPKIVKVSPESTEKRGGRYIGREPSVDDRAGLDPDFLVHWRKYSEIEQKLNWPRVPSSFKVWVTQEDLWVYVTLLRIIRDTNEGATGPHDAVVKEIRLIQVGQDASRAPSGSIYRPEEAEVSGTSATASTESSEGGGNRFASMRRGVEGEAMNDEEEKQMLLEDRYVDENGQPVATAIGDGETSEFKRLPVRLELQMDYRELPRLLIACANAALPVEVKQIRVNAEAGSGNTGSRENFRRSLRPPTDGGGRRGDATAAPDPAIVPIIIQGVIYIFNPPDSESLGQIATN